MVTLKNGKKVALVRQEKGNKETPAKMDVAKKTNKVTQRNANKVINKSPLVAQEDSATVIETDTKSTFGAQTAENKSTHKIAIPKKIDTEAMPTVIETGFKLLPESTVKQTAVARDPKFARKQVSNLKFREQSQNYFGMNTTGALKKFRKKKLAAKFLLFMGLPLELRQKIWEYNAAKARVIEVNVTHFQYLKHQFDSRYPYPIISTTTAGPAMLQVCSESRAIGLASYRKLFMFNYQGRAIYFNPKFDSVVIHSNENSFGTHAEDMWGVGYEGTKDFELNTDFIIPPTGFHFNHDRIEYLNKWPPAPRPINTSLESYHKIGLAWVPRVARGVYTANRQFSPITVVMKPYVDKPVQGDVTCREQLEALMKAHGVTIHSDGGSQMFSWLTYTNESEWYGFWEKLILKIEKITHDESYRRR